MPELSYQQNRFIEEYLSDPERNGRAAAIRAGYAPMSASVTACRTLQIPEVQEIVKSSDKARAQKLGFTAERILGELAKIAFADLSKGIVYDEHGDPLPSDTTEMSVETASSDKGGRTKAVKLKTLKTADKIAALVQIGKHLGIFNEKVEVSGTMSLIDLVTKSFEQTKPELEITPLEDSG